MYIAELIKKNKLIYFDIASSSGYADFLNLHILITMQYRNISIQFCTDFATYTRSIRLLTFLSLSIMLRTTTAYLSACLRLILLMSPPRVLCTAEAPAVASVPPCSVYQRPADTAARLSQSASLI